MIQNLNECRPECTECVKQYIEKHRLRELHGKFEIPCTGIPLQYIPESILATSEDPEVSIGMLDPVTWAARWLDWHCIDPDGKIWKRKTLEGTLGEVTPYIPELAVGGHSPFNRPYQALLLKCSATRKVLRLGRQCLTGDTRISLANGSTKQITDIRVGDIILSRQNNSTIPVRVLEFFPSGVKRVYSVWTKQGRQIRCTSDHRFLTDNFLHEWMSIDTGLGQYSKIAVLNGWDYISEIKEEVNEETFDLEVENTHNFIANGIVVHNSGKSWTLDIAILHSIFTKQNYQATIIAPYQVQIDVLFGHMEKFIKSNPTLWNSVARFVKAPNYSLTLKNGSTAIGFSCIAGTKITTDIGYKNIEDIQIGDKVLSLNEDSNTLLFRKVTDVFLPNYKKVWKVTLRNGYSVTISEDHPLWEKNKTWKKLKNLVINDKVASVNTFNHQNSLKPDPLAYLFGLLLGDGNYTFKTMEDGGPRFTSKNLTVQKHFEDTLQNLNTPWRSQYHAVTGSKEYTIRKRFAGKEKFKNNTLTPITALLEKYHLIGQRSFSKIIPEQLLNDVKYRYGILQGLLETDGWLEKTGRIGIATVSPILAEQISWLLNSFGIKNQITIKKQKGKKTPINTEQRVIYSNYDVYQIYIYGKFYCRKILSLFDLFHKKNYSDCSSVVQSGEYQTEDLSFTKIKSIEFVGHQTTYDFQVGNGENSFVANGIVLHNTAGSKGGNEASSVRGQAGGLLIYDEADMLSDKDIDSSLAPIINFPDAVVWMSSTPTGKRDRFFKTCNSQNWKEFHFPSSVNPLWNEQLEAFFRDTLTADGYKHEIESIFGEQEQGVYQAKYIEQACADYEYGQYKQTIGWLYSIGVDWNDPAIGVCIAVVGRNPLDGRFYVLDKKVVSHSEYTQLKACEDIKIMNRLWSPFAIYADKGHGGTQEEIITLFGKTSAIQQGRNSPDAALGRIFHAYNFSESIETFDPFTKQPMKKHAKAFLVENSVRRFEQDQIRFPMSDKNYIASLHGYIIKRMSMSGYPVYEETHVAGDHFLDAVNLALVAFILEKTDFGKPKFSTSIATTPPIPLMAINEREVEKHKPKSRVIAAPTKDIKLWAWPGFERDEPKPVLKRVLKPRRRLW